MGNIKRHHPDSFKAKVALELIKETETIAAICSKYSIHPTQARKMNIIRPNQVWSTDITYIKAAKIWFYLVAIMDWFSRYVLAWKLSPSLSGDFCTATLCQALKTDIPEIHNSDQGSQFTAQSYLEVLNKKNRSKSAWTAEVDALTTFLRKGCGGQ